MCDCAQGAGYGRARWTASNPFWQTCSIRDEVRVALGDLLDGFVLTVLIAVAIGTIYYGVRLVKELRRSIGR